VRRSSDGADAQDRRSRAPQERRIGVRLDMLRAELKAGKNIDFSADDPGAGRAIL